MDALVIASKVKKMIKEESGMSTSSTVIDKLSEIVRKECKKAVENAKKANRKTVMDRDFHESV